MLLVSVEAICIQEAEQKPKSVQKGIQRWTVNKKQTKSKQSTGKGQGAILDSELKTGSRK